MRVFFGCGDRGWFSSVILGISHVIDQQMKNRTRRIIINLSLLGPISQAVDDAINDATEHGILVVVAAGNEFKDACKYVYVGYIVAVNEYKYINYIDEYISLICMYICI